MGTQPIAITAHLVCDYRILTAGSVGALQAKVRELMHEGPWVPQGGLTVATSAAQSDRLALEPYAQAMVLHGPV